MTIHWKALEQYFTVLLFVFTQFVILENLSVLDLALSGMKGLSEHAFELSVPVIINIAKLMLNCLLRDRSSCSFGGAVVVKNELVFVSDSPGNRVHIIDIAKNKVSCWFCLQLCTHITNTGHTL